MKHWSFTRLHLLLAFFLVLGAALGALLLRERDSKARQHEANEEEWDKMLRAAAVGRWILTIPAGGQVADGTLAWDEGMHTVFHTKPEDFRPTYDFFAMQVSERDAGWLGETVTRVLEEFSTYRATFKLKNGRYVRAYGGVFSGPNGATVFSGICTPGVESEYTGKVATSTTALPFTPSPAIPSTLEGQMPGICK